MNINRAIYIATEAHRDQKDKVDKPYITHVMRVMERCKTDEEKIVAVLHDVVEDCSHLGWTIERLREEFSASVVDAVDAITKRENESKMDYIERVKQNPIAVRVKLNDLEDNMDIRRLPEITDRDVERLRRYLRTYKDLLVITQDQLTNV
ncbi:MAG: HD domain-containing protein [Bacteroidetes bacterium]|nr:HD domain-containing protein [Bacteroidota bacterium]